jgi:L-arabinose isomerase
MRAEVNEWIEAARVAQVMEHNRLGLMGHYYGGMLDIYSDLTQQCAYFGGHVEIIEVEELATLRREGNTTEASRRVEEFKTSFDVQEDCPVDALLRAAPSSVALMIGRTPRAGSVAYYKGVGRSGE